MAQEGGERVDGAPALSPLVPTRARALRPGRRSRLPVERVQVVEKMLMACEPHRRIERDLAKRWSLTRRQIREYIKRVYDDWGAGSDEAPKYMRERIRAGFEEILRRALRAGEHSAAVTAQDRLAKLAAAYPSEAPQIGITVNAHAEILHGDPEKDRARLEELRQREAEKKGGGGA